MKEHILPLKVFFEILRSSNILFSKSDFDMIRIIWTSNLIFMIQIYWYI